MLLLCFVYTFRFEGVKVEATGKENRIFNVSFFAFPSSSRTGVSGTLKHPKWQAYVRLHYVYHLRTYVFTLYLANEMASTLSKGNVILFWN
jgi:hypothetical protein